ncbi:protein disulfide-isomerase-like [Iris pallida]|uniref:Protein disulfide-isomerase-like n=1 Tax=Iris pallida TaxID=29817 RepID=A0AAX6IIF1_IRIPA|nr:protein disulfide-isomerase-like [Iris pallida]
MISFPLCLFPLTDCSVILIWSFHCKAKYATFNRSLGYWAISI